MSYLQSEEVSKMLQERTRFYGKENAKMEAVFKKLGLDPNGYMCPESKDVRENLLTLQQRFDVKKLATSDVVMSYANKQKENNFSHNSAVLNMYFKVYDELNRDLRKEIDHLNTVYTEAKRNIDEIVKVPADQLQIIEKKIVKYENELAKLEGKHPWLKNKELHVLNFSKEISVLEARREEKKRLLQEISRFHGLKPDLHEANKQLSEIKREVEDLSKKMYSCGLKADLLEASKWETKSAVQDVPKN